MAEIEVEIIRPVNPAGRSFITNVYGAVAARDREIIDKYKREFTKIVQRLGFKIEETIGTGKLITGKIVLVVDENKKPLKAYSLEISVWNIEKTLKEKIEVAL
ncbi:hypothetical protein BA065_01375 [Nanoarchaeota archaeon NZ13-N]|uniref:Uncharacterized protein n=1 Tax=Candidatus Nanoclepta minutus TaxID=1940235 RepID=A0A397WMZ6_9ARCH|nr:MAG: hypothetical protein BA065_01375 [Nanoarchaeota archaeon NZ13-N]RIB35440.1 MAG: hypothetical protein BXU00_01600 [Candidatus Nanoclepta minutus]